MISKELIESALKTVIDPELGQNIVDLGLIYNIALTDNRTPITITMTLTTPGCPLAPYFLTQVKEVVAAAASVEPEEVDVQIVFDPPWTQDMMSEELKLQMGL